MSDSRVEIREVGVITEIKRGVVKLSGLPTCIMGQLIELAPGVLGFVIGFTDTEVLALTLGQEAALSVGQQVDVRQQPPFLHWKILSLSAPRGYSIMKYLRSDPGDDVYPADFLREWLRPRENYFRGLPRAKVRHDSGG